MMKDKTKKIAMIIALLFVLFAIMSSLLFGNTVLYIYDNSKHLANNWAYSGCGEKSVPLKRTDINVISCWKICKKMDAVVVGVVDTGIDFDNISNNIWKNCKEVPGDGIDNDANGFIDDCEGWDFYNNDATLYDNYVYDHHGTYVANAIVSIAPNAQICNAKFISSTYGDAKDSVAAIEYVVSQGAEVVNCSWSFGEEEEQLFELMKAYPDVLFVCAAGNANINLDQQALYPACYDLGNVVCVSSMNMEGGLYDYCAYGERVDIVAPGENVAVILPESDCSYVDGTSVSAALVAGTAALIKGLDEELTASEIKRIILDTANQQKLLFGECKANGSLNVGKAVREVIKDED